MSLNFDLILCVQIYACVYGLLRSLRGGNFGVWGTVCVLQCVFSCTHMSQTHGHTNGQTYGQTNGQRGKQAVCLLEFDYAFYDFLSQKIGWQTNINVFANCHISMDQ